MMGDVNPSELQEMPRMSQSQKSQNLALHTLNPSVVAQIQYTQGNHGSYLVQSLLWYDMA